MARLSAYNRSNIARAPRVAISSPRRTRWASPASVRALVGARRCSRPSRRSSATSGSPRATSIPHQVEISGLLTAFVGLISPALNAQLDASNGMLYSAIGTVVLFLANWGLAHWHISDPVQGVITAVLILVAGLFVPAVHLQQATFYKFPGRSETRKAA
ncbi:MAG TPA: hypothetical protein VIV12_24395 [Streptosporangiaceae bacterium]